MSYLFIFGEQRTGSTLLHSILKNHPQIAATPNDLNILDLCSFKGIKLFPYNKDLNKLDQWNLGDLISFSKSIEGKPRELILKIVLDTFFKNKEEEIKVHKTPKAEHNLDIYREVFKNSLFIYLIRNPFAIISSKKYWKHVSRWKKLEGSNITFEKIRYTLKIIEKTLERIFKSIKISTKDI